MSIKDSTREYRLSGWLPIIKECRNSGMSVKNWCEQNNVNEKRFYYWQRKLREPSMILKVGNVSLELSETFQPELLASVLKVLTHA
jgi:putative transposase